MMADVRRRTQGPPGGHQGTVVAIPPFRAVVLPQADPAAVTTLGVCVSGQ